MNGRYILLIILFFVRTVSAQEFKAGLRFGMDASQVDGDKLVGFNKVGILGGAYVNRKLSDHVTMQMELVFIQKGSRKPTDDLNTYYRLRVHYIEVPLMVRYSISRKFDLEAGPSFGTLIFSEENDELGVYQNTPPFKKFEFSGNAGIVYKLSDNWFFDGRYSNSITTIRPYQGEAISTPSNFFDQGEYNVVVEFSLLCQF